MTEFGAAWGEVMEWIGENQLQLDDRPCCEVHLNDHEQHPEGRFIVDICQTVKRR
ncbi:MAG TPA: AraC family transcriptional regulator [candidate division WOR-3 bacterium]|uniref:AraC family transcriptional regulator n=1 Tax=candidate division WOR-3 bacterium TaxID=2052148 RepID=A0A7V0T5Q3_UNCW3|nr:AraC family transcriptional regulator [candidate division WOR-3 bacterium]